MINRYEMVRSVVLPAFYWRENENQKPNEERNTVKSGKKEN